MSPSKPWGTARRPRQSDVEASAPPRVWHDMEFRKLKAAERERRSRQRRAASFSIVSRGQYAAFDQFTDLLEHGAAVSRHQRKYLVGIPSY